MKKINFKKVFNTRNSVFLLFILGSVFLFGHLAHAEVFGEWAGTVVGGIIALFIRAISSILILLVGVLMNVASYSDFINAPAVAKGWVVVRDLCNMFFVVILLIIAFATILGQEEYGAKKMLPKLIMAAVLINFSKLICGLMIDVSNVVMLTFVNAFSAIGAGNLLDMLGISEITQIAVSSDSAAVTFGTIVSAYIFGLIYVVIATVVVAAMLGMLVVRLVMIWILVVLSPLAFFLQAVPGKGAQYAGQWWSRWTSNLLVGPIIAFFLWLSFASLQGGNPIAVTDNADLTANNANLTEVDSGLGSQAGTPSSMAKFVIAIGMLLGGMKIAQEVGGEAGGAMGKIFSKGKGMATAAGIGALTAGGKAAGRGARNVTLAGAGKLANSAIFNKNEKDIVTGKRKGTGVGNFALQWKDDLAGARKKEKVASREKFLKKIGIGEKSAEIGKDLLNTDGMQKLGRVSRGAANYASVGTAIGGGFGPVGNLVGGTVGLLAGGIGGYQSKKNYDKAKVDIKNYEQKDSSGISQKSRDEGYTKLLQNRKDVAKANGVVFDLKKDATPEEIDALNRAKQNEKNKKIVGGKDILGATTGGPIAFERTGKAMDSMTKKKKAAKEWVEVASNEPDLLKNINKPSEIYSSAGLSENWKKRFEELNGTDVKSVKAVDNMTAEINDVANPLDGKKMEAFAKALMAFKKGDGKIDVSTLGRIETALTSKGYNPTAYDGKVSTQYKQVGSDMEVHAGSGGLQYNAFAKNSAKAVTDRNSSKDIMGASFEKINNKAKELGVDYKLDSAAGANQKIEGAQLGNLSKVMSGLIDDEIKALQSVGGEVSSQKISELNTAKSRLNAGNLSGLSLKNTDVSYKGATATEKRQAEYNTTQHEIMHQSGAKDEELVNDSASALQDAKLIGRVPQADPESGGKRYDEIIGKMIANMEQAKVNPDEIRSAIDNQIEKWTPSNAQRVVETEKGQRDTVKDVIPEINTEKLDQMTEKFDTTVDRLINNIGRESVSGNQKNAASMSVEDRNFFMRTFNSLKKTVSRGDELVGNKLKPLSAIALKEESDKIEE